jgi:hypothetical protein
LARYELHSKDQLAELGKELGRTPPAGGKSSMIGFLLESVDPLPFPKSLGAAAAKTKRKPR